MVKNNKKLEEMINRIKAGESIYAISKDIKKESQNISKQLRNYLGY
jgi:hypothetical protein